MLCGINKSQIAKKKTPINLKTSYMYVKLQRTITIFRYLMDQLTACDLNLNIGLVQTAYANGASTDYIQNKLVSAFFS